MGRNQITLRATTEREKNLERAKEVLGADSNAAAVDAGLVTIVELFENFEDVKEEISPNLAKRLSTSHIRLTQYPQVRTD